VPEDYTSDIIRVSKRRRPEISTIVTKITSGKYRFFEYLPVYGTNLITKHKEHGFRYRLKDNEVFSSYKVGDERKRISGLLRPVERILVPFIRAAGRIRSRLQH